MEIYCQLSSFYPDEAIEIRITNVTPNVGRPEDVTFVRLFMNGTYQSLYDFSSEYIKDGDKPVNKQFIVDFVEKGGISKKWLAPLEGQTQDFLPAWNAWKNNDESKVRPDSK